MYLLQNTNCQASTIFRGLLTVIFIAWLATVMTQYDKKTKTQKSEVPLKQPTSNIVIEPLTLPPIPKPIVAAEPKVLAESKLAKPSIESATKLLKELKQLPQTPPVNKQQVKQVYQQLSDTGVDIQIAWPHSVNERQVALDFMYQCVGVQFAVLSGNTFTKINHTKINHTKANHSISSDYSDWVRVAQGSLSKKEYNWLNAYALKGTPIRLFPRSIDWRLAQRLADALKGVPLDNLRAKYQVTNHRLQLIDIQINGLQITDSWTLYQGKCEGFRL